MKDLKLWKFIVEQFKQKQPVIFLSVLESKGSSPGRQGFKMAVTPTDMCGSVGGGIMEHKFVELAKDLLKRQSDEAFIRQQVHSKNASANQSGMICSGEQTLAVYPLKEDDIKVVERIIESSEINVPLVFGFSPKGFSVVSNSSTRYFFEKKSETDFYYEEDIGYRPVLHIIGGGHCALALSKLMKDLSFYIKVYDNRKELNTLQQNIYADEIKIIEYERIGELFPSDVSDEFVAVMTFGYRTDGIVIRQLANKYFEYLGLLGSESKIKMMIAELHDEGFDKNWIDSIYTPIGIPIHSQTPEEIAVSIAAEIIKVKNT